VASGEDLTGERSPSNIVLGNWRRDSPGSQLPIAFTIAVESGILSPSIGS
jgi:hypothetical protein